MCIKSFVLYNFAKISSSDQSQNTALPCTIGSRHYSVPGSSIRSMPHLIMFLFGKADDGKKNATPKYEESHMRITKGKDSSNGSGASGSDRIHESHGTGASNRLGTAFATRAGAHIPVPPVEAGFGQHLCGGSFPYPSACRNKVFFRGEACATCSVRHCFATFL